MTKFINPFLLEVHPLNEELVPSIGQKAALAAKFARLFQKESKVELFPPYHFVSKKVPFLEPFLGLFIRRES